MQEAPSPRDLILVGARLDGHAGVVLDLVRDDPRWRVVGFLDNTPELAGKLVAGLPVLGGTAELEHDALPDAAFHIAIGDNVGRGKLHRVLTRRGAEVVTLVHPTAVVSERAVLGSGCYVGPGAVVNAGCAIGDAVLINSGVILEHDALVGFAAHLAPGSCTGGRVTIGEYGFVGLGSTVLPDVEIGSGVLVGAGSTVIRSVSPHTTVMGYAARPRSEKTNIYAETTPDVNTLGSGRLDVTRPTLPDRESFEASFGEIHASGYVSNFGRFNCRLEGEIRERLQVEHALTLPNATSGLMLLLRVLGLSGEVLVPSFTFAATGHAVLWNDLTPVFVDIDPLTLTVDPADLERKLTSRTSAILGVHTFGNPCDTDALAELAEKHGLRLIYDAAHALGSRVSRQAVGGFGDAEVFSLSGTKVVTCGEGALLTSNDSHLVRELCLGRNYGAGEDYDCSLLGLNGKMSEYHAAIALESLRSLDRFVEARNRIARRYRQQLQDLPGLEFQQLPCGHRSTFKDMALIVDPDRFGVDRDSLVARLEVRGIFPKRYFHPPLHRMQLYRAQGLGDQVLPVTERVSERVISLPIYSHMQREAVDRVCRAIRQSREEPVSRLESELAAAAVH